MVNLVPPHGGKLLPCLLTGDERDTALSEARALPKVRLSSKEASDLIMLAMGAFSPLHGFMGKADYQRVVREMRLTNGLLWPIPITLSISKEDADKIREFVRKLVELIEMKAYGETIVVNFGEDERVAGYSMMQLIETSLISAHFANQSNAVYLDVFSCKKFDPQVVADFAKRFFEAERVRVSSITRE